ncbi:hypothetical protein Q7P37_003133 [Cladosporium fusiforme]
MLQHTGLDTEPSSRRRRRRPPLAAALEQAMNTPHSPFVESPSDLPAPEPHLPLRKASAQRLQQQNSRRSATRPLITPTSHGFNPSPVEPLPHIDNVSASSEHAFAGRDERAKRPFRMPPGVQAMRDEPDMRMQQSEPPSSSSTIHENERPPSSPIIPPPSPRFSTKLKKLRSPKSLGEGLRGLKYRVTSGHSTSTRNGRDTPDSISAIRPGFVEDETRQSSRSALTSHSSFANTDSMHTTDRSSNATGHSSHSEFVNVYPHWPETEQGKESFDVDDMIGMYEDGFESVKGSMDVPKRSMDAPSRRSIQEYRPSSAQSHRASMVQKKPMFMHRRSQSASLLTRIKPPIDDTFAPPPPPTINDLQRTSTQIMSGQGLRDSADSRQALNTKTAPLEPVPRDRYGFKKASHHVTVQQYDAWDRHYSEHIERRRVPPEWRGAAWWWYSGGPGFVAKHPDLYRRLLGDVEDGKLSANDREHIERDLNRTFPDNAHFKPDPTTAAEAQNGVAGNSGRKSVDPEVPVVRALRRVLQAFAVHNPSIGYCQSLNFIAGLLLLFLDQNEEQAFVLLTFITSTHLPGTHGVTLEGANIDIAVLMSCIKDALPTVWAKLDDQGSGGGVIAADDASQTLRLPTVSLATTAWFMSLFVGTLPIESVLRVWDCLFFEGSKTLFRIALSIFKSAERQIMPVNDPMEVFQVVQTSPRSMLDINALMEVCFRRRGGFANVSQEMVERRREERRAQVKMGVVHRQTGLTKLKGKLRRGTTKI